MEEYDGSTVYYEAMSGGFVRLQSRPEEDEIDILDPIEKGVLDTVPMANVMEEDYLPVSENTLENPDEVVESYLEKLVNDHVETPLPMDEYVELQWARKVTTVESNI